MLMKNSVQFVHSNTMSCVSFNHRDMHKMLTSRLHGVPGPGSAFFCTSCLGEFRNLATSLAMCWMYFAASPKSGSRTGSLLLSGGQWWTSPWSVTSDSLPWVRLITALSSLLSGAYSSSLLPTQLLGDFSAAPRAHFDIFISPPSKDNENFIPLKILKFCRPYQHLRCPMPSSPPYSTCLDPAPSCWVCKFLLHPTRSHSLMPSNHSRHGLPLLDSPSIIPNIASFTVP